MRCAAWMARFDDCRYPQERSDKQTVWITRRCNYDRPTANNLNSASHLQDQQGAI